MLTKSLVLSVTLVSFSDISMPPTQPQPCSSLAGPKHCKYTFQRLPACLYQSPSRCSFHFFCFVRERNKKLFQSESQENPCRLRVLPSKQQCNIKKALPYSQHVHNVLGGNISGCSCRIWAPTQAGNAGIDYGYSLLYCCINIGQCLSIRIVEVYRQHALVHKALFHIYI